MPRQVTDRTVRVHLHLYEDDWEFIKTYFQGPDNISPSAAVRTILRAHLNKLRTRIEAVARPVSLTSEEEAPNE